MYEQVVEMHNIKLVEVMAALTDFIVAGMAFYAWYNTSSTAQKATYFKRHFLLMGLATLFGGVLGHALKLYVPLYFKLPGWWMSMLSVTFLERAIIEEVSGMVSKTFTKWLYRFNILELAVFAMLSMFTLNFKFVEWHSAYGLFIVVFGLGFVVWFKRGFHSVRWLMLGVLFGATAAVVFTQQLTIHYWFNHVDLSHVLLAGSVYSFYKLSNDT